MDESTKVRVSGVAQVDTPFGPTPILLLEDDRERVLVIAVGGAEASSIAIALSGEHLPVPNTHDFMMNVLGEMSIRVKRGEIYDLQSNRFLARVILEGEKGESIIDGRPSDVIALAVRAGADIYVTEDVMQKASIEKSALLREREEGEGEEEGGEE
ncbi:MAG: bifunctional nuclease family protein [Candidatus Bathyarchaeia archaeon]